MSNFKEELTQLRAENKLLKELLASHGINYPVPNEEVTAEPNITLSSVQLSPAENIKLFRSLFRGRDDVYPIRWESGQSGKSGYSPVCANEWRKGICEKPRIKCSDCNHGLYVPVTDFVISQHLQGKITAGIYPLLKDDRCYFLAIDFDDGEWREDAKAVLQTSLENNLPAVLEISRSGEGAHLWLFFASAVPARDARRLGAALISATCSRTRQLKLTSYDRLFPNQDTLPKGGLARRDDLPEFLSKYGQIIIDEAHHLSAQSFEAVLKQGKPHYVLGLSATPVRSNGHHPIIFMQCGPIRHVAKRPTHVPGDLLVQVQKCPSPLIPDHTSIQEVIRLLSCDNERNMRIVADTINALNAGRKVLLLTKRTEHLELLRNGFKEISHPCFVLHGRMKFKERQLLIKELAALPADTPHLLLASAQLVGEGFDHAPLDTLILALPISWSGTLQQYAGRLHREYAGKTDVLIHDYAELDHPQLARMWEKRQRGYKNMGYRVEFA